MWLLLLVSQVLLLCHAQQFVPNANCPHPIYLKQSDVTPWVGITVDTNQTTEIVNGLNLFKCTPDTLFVYLTLNGVLTRQDWWLACKDTATNGWRVRDAGSKNTNYGMIPVGCVKPTCGGLAMFDGTEYILRNYTNYQVVPTKPLMLTNGKFQIYCLGGSNLGFESSGKLFFGPGISVVCEEGGWWIKTTATSTGSYHDVTRKVGCFKEITPPTLPAACSTGITYFTGSEQILKDNPDYAMTADKAAVVSGQWRLNCPAVAGIGYADSAKFTYAPTVTIKCDSYGWWLATPENPSGTVLSPDLKVGCFRKQIVRDPSPAHIACGCWYKTSNCPTCNTDKLFVLDGFGALSGKCTLGCGSGYVFEDPQMNMISCHQGNWLGSSSSVTNTTIPLAAPQGYIVTSCVPAPTPPKCSLRYTTFNCVGCDATKIIPLQSTKSPEGCVISCDKDYRMLVLDGTGTVTRAQEVVVSSIAWFTVYPLGEVTNTIKMNYQGVKFSCEKVDVNITEPVVVPELVKVPECGCPYTADLSKPESDPTKLFIQNTGTGKCSIQCDAGYRLTGLRSSAFCKDNAWNAIMGNTENVIPVSPAKFSCEPAPATCGQTYKIAPCKAGQECDPQQIRAIQGSKSNCILTCARGYRLFEQAFGDVLQEAWYSVGALIGNQDCWKGVIIDKTSIIYYNNDTVPAYNCERYKAPSEEVTPTPSTDLPCPQLKALGELEYLGIKNGMHRYQCPGRKIIRFKTNFEGESIYHAKYLDCNSTFIQPMSSSEFKGTIGNNELTEHSCRDYGTYNNVCFLPYTANTVWNQNSLACPKGYYAKYFGYIDVTNGNKFAELDSMTHAVSSLALCGAAGWTLSGTTYKDIQLQYMTCKPSSVALQWLSCPSLSIAEKSVQYDDTTKTFSCYHSEGFEEMKIVTSSGTFYGNTLQCLTASKTWQFVGVSTVQIPAGSSVQCYPKNSILPPDNFPLIYMGQFPGGLSRWKCGGGLDVEIIMDYSADKVKPSHAAYIDANATFYRVSSSINYYYHTGNSKIRSIKCVDLGPKNEVCSIPWDIGGIRKGNSYECKKGYFLLAVTPIDAQGNIERLRDETTNTQSIQCNEDGWAMAGNVNRRGMRISSFECSDVHPGMAGTQCNDKDVSTAITKMQFDYFNKRFNCYEGETFGYTLNGVTTKNKDYYLSCGADKKWIMGTLANPRIAEAPIGAKFDCFT